MIVKIHTISKQEFRNKKGNFGDKIMSRMLTKKILNHLNSFITELANSKIDLTSFELKSTKLLEEKFNSRMPIQLILTIDKRYLFIIKNNKVIQFVFELFTHK